MRGDLQINLQATMRRGKMEMAGFESMRWMTAKPATIWQWKDGHDARVREKMEMVSFEICNKFTKICDAYKMSTLHTSSEERSGRAMVAVRWRTARMFRAACLCRRLRRVMAYVNAGTACTQRPWRRRGKRFRQPCSMI
ncbi:hypothetical protein AVEN_130434-1 [Araneus ventricosus]|uniref:Uncharacterized protein n=1 Tax=Araneus ventricosus TaxID=182803 RepID=A0A4Y2SDM6_ARAVE|nr:hypothetical protein AVEN_130434-1 [Araneus ventricosus]